MSRLSALMLILTATVNGSAPFQQRDVPSDRASARAGTSAISGIAVTDGPQNLPLRRVTVTLSDTSRAETRTISTDDNGRFLFRGLPAGRYLLSAAKAAYLTTSYGSKGPSRVNATSLGTALVVADGQQVADLTIRLARGGVLTGTVRHPNGRPAIATRVSVAYYGRLPSGERSLFAATGAATDDRGEYRIYGLAPGDYIVYASAPVLAPSGEVLTTTAADLQRAQSVLSGRPTQLLSGLTQRHETAWFSSVYFPGTSLLSDATIIALAAGEQRAGLDFQLQLVPTAQVEGTVIGVNGQPAANATVQLVSQRSPIALIATATTDAEGRFRFSGIEPLSCSIVSRANRADAPAGQEGLPSFGVLDIEVRGEDVTAEVRLQPGTSVSGRAVFDDSVTTPTSDFARVRITLTPVPTNIALGPHVLTIQPDGSFVANGLPPGRYRLGVRTQSGGPITSMSLKSAVFRAQDVLDTLLDVQPGQDITGATLTFTQRTADITGKMIDANGAPVPEYFVIVFAADSRYWAPMSRRIQQVRPARDGSFAFRNLPPGHYLINAVTDIEQGQWFDPDFLGLLVTGATKVTLADGEKKALDFLVGVR